MPAGACLTSLVWDGGVTVASVPNPSGAPMSGLGVAVTGVRGFGSAVMAVSGRSMAVGTSVVSSLATLMATTRTIARAPAASSQPVQRSQRRERMGRSGGGSGLRAGGLVSRTCGLSRTVGITASSTCHLISLSSRVFHHELEVALYPRCGILDESLRILRMGKKPVSSAPRSVHT